MKWEQVAPAWRRHAIVVESPLPTRAALARLRSGRLVGFALVRRSLDVSNDEHAVVGHVSGDRIQLTALQPGLPNLWRPVLLGRLIPTYEGSALVGEFGWRPAVGAMSVLWVGALVVLGAFGILDTTVAALSGHLHSARNGLLLALMAVGMALVLLRLVAVTTRWGDADERYLRSWLTERLAVPAPRPSHHRPSAATVARRRTESGHHPAATRQPRRAPEWQAAAVATPRKRVAAPGPFAPPPGSRYFAAPQEPRYRAQLPVGGPHYLAQSPSREPRYHLGAPQGPPQAVPQGPRIGDRRAERTQRQPQYSPRPAATPEGRRRSAAARVSTRPLAWPASMHASSARPHAAGP